jgi:hypothetical protein
MWFAAGTMQDSDLVQILGWEHEARQWVAWIHQALQWSSQGRIHHEYSWCLKMRAGYRYMTPWKVRSLKEKIIIVQPSPGQCFIISVGTSCDCNNVEMITEAYRASCSLYVLSEMTRFIPPIDTQSDGLRFFQRKPDGHGTRFGTTQDGACEN